MNGNSNGSQTSKPACDICGGSGWLIADLPVGHQNFGKPFPCECKRDEIALRRMAKLNKIDGLTDAERAYSFGTETTQQATAAAAALQRMILNGAGLATLTGPFGVGKTYLLIAAVNMAKAQGKPAHYTTMRDLLAYLRQAFNPTNTDETFDERWNLLTTAPVLAIDEMDKANASQWALEQFSALVDIRWRNMRSDVTIFAMNAEISALPGDIQDRLQDARAEMFAMSGASQRQF